MTGDVSHFGTSWSPPTWANEILYAFHRQSLDINRPNVTELWSHLPFSQSVRCAGARAVSEDRRVVPVVQFIVTARNKSDGRTVSLGGSRRGYTQRSSTCEPYTCSKLLAGVFRPDRPPSFVAIDFR